MKRTITFLFVLFLFFNAYTQSNQNWKTDLDTLKKRLLQREYLFTKISKKEFVVKINLLQQNNSKNNDFRYWELFELLKNFEVFNLELQNRDFKKFPFAIKQFKNKYYLTSIHSDFGYCLGYQLISINSIKVEEIIKVSQSVDKLNIKLFLEYFGFSNNNNLKLSLLSKNNQELEINVSYSEINSNDLVKITPKKTPFYLRKPNKWFWKYGINFGKQVYFKYNVGLSKEFIKKVKNSLHVSELTISKNYKLSLQEIYDAPTFNDFSNNLFLKFKKRRYKKLFIDLRNNKTGNVKALHLFISRLKKLRRINKKNRLYVFIDKSISSSVFETILELKNKLNILIIGDKITGIACSTNAIDSFYLPYSEFKIFVPNKMYKAITIKPDVLVVPSITNYINGVDPILQKALN